MVELTNICRLRVLPSTLNHDHTTTTQNQILSGCPKQISTKQAGSRVIFQFFARHVREWLASKGQSV